MPGAESNYTNGVRENQQQNMQVQWYYFTMRGTHYCIHNGTISQCMVHTIVFTMVLIHNVR